MIRSDSIVIPQDIKTHTQTQRQQDKKQGTMDLQNNQKMNKMAIVSSYLSIMTLNLNGLNSPLKRHTKTKWIKKKNPQICCLQETHIGLKDTQTLRVTRKKKKRYIKQSIINKTKHE